MHYHVYVGPQIDAMPKDIFSFNSSESAIEKVMELLASLDASDDIVDMSHLENDAGRFSVILVPKLQYKIVLHECEHACAQNKAPIDLKPTVLN